MEITDTVALEGLHNCCPLCVRQVNKTLAVFGTVTMDGDYVVVQGKELGKGQVLAALNAAGMNGKITQPRAITNDQ